VTGPDAVLLTAADGATARCEVPFPPLRGSLVEHCQVERRVGVLLVRLGGYAAGVFAGRELVSSKVGSRQVHGRSAAGGQSQQRFARRREGQVRVALDAAADNAVRILLPAAATLDAVVLGGDRSAVEEVLADRRLAPLRPLVTGRVLDVPDPRLKVLMGTPDQFRAVRIEIVDPIGITPP
jgi:peptide subunit release factor 1 (eRF1)